jgi:hypothetical protein
MAAMTIQELDPTDDDDDDVTTYRARARNLLDQIAGRSRDMLAEHGIETQVFFLIPNSGNNILTYGTPDDPPDEEWRRVAQIVSSVVQQAVGLDRTQCQEVTCATTEDSGWSSGTGGKSR